MIARMDANKSTTAWLLALGALVAGIGLYLGAAPMGDCGSPWFPDWAAADKEARIGKLTGAMTGFGYDGDPRQSCRDQFGSRGTFGTGLVVLGGGSLIAGGVVRSKSGPGPHTSLKATAGGEPPTAPPGTKESQTNA
ncbi:hypothetical protein NHG22_33620 [Streptomyces sp. ATE26]|uniref:hypothetical protein n=1 Tax=Streptomyces sp. ATE26 TaxID=2954237 RepID=UPI0024829EF3|nr:hypothetical protein [Streptomyces sp. ATE26]MDI1458717.1 hypothetical protein [Streptomyces sp. ATE26]